MIALASLVAVAASQTLPEPAFAIEGCFRQLKDADGKEATSGLSCTIWIPRG